MKEKRNILIGIGLGAILGWTLGFLRLPYLEKNYSFSLGFFACLSIFLITFLIISVWKKNITFFQSFRQNSSTKSLSKTSSLLWFFVSTLIVLGGITSSFLFFQQNQFSKNQVQQMDQHTAEQVELMVTTRKSNAVVLMNSLAEKIEEELNNNPQRTLSNEIIERIAALNYSFEPYQLKNKNWSPERGQLLLMLTKMNIDSSSFNLIKSKTSFLGADLEEADLSGADLSNTDLREANLNHAKLIGTNLKNANLKKASLQKANLEKAFLNKTFCQYADIQWAEFQSAEMIKADFSGADLSNSNLKNVNLTQSLLKWVNLSNTFLNDSNLAEADLFEANLTRANLEKTNLSNSDLTTCIFSGANLNQTNLTDVKSPNLKIDVQNWFEKLENWNVIGVEKLKENYKVISDISPYYKYKLQPIKK